MSWLATIDDEDELRRAFTGSPDAKYRPVLLWWWSGEPLDQERLLWQLERIAELGFGAICVTGLGLQGPSAGTGEDTPTAYSDEWLALYVVVGERARDLGLKVVSWSPFLAAGPVGTWALVNDQPELRGQVMRPAASPGDGPVIETFGLDWGNPGAMKLLLGSGESARYLEAIDHLMGDVIVASFEDELPMFNPWAPGLASEFEAQYGYPPPLEVLAGGETGARTPADRVALFDFAVGRVERAYTAAAASFYEDKGLLSGYDQMSRTGDPLMSSLCYLDPFRTMAWATAPGTDHMGDARFHLSLADLSGAPRVWLEGFHSHGWGHPLELQARLLFEHGREGANLFLAHGGYYSTRAGWWEWAPPETAWRQPYARHYPPFAEAIGRLMTVLSAGHHVPEVAVLYPLTTVWAATTNHREWGPEAIEANETYLALHGVHGAPSGWEPERAQTPSLLADAGYDRMVVDEAHINSFAPIPVIVPACRCLRTSTVEALVDAAESGRLVIVCGPAPEWSAENGRDDAAFLALVERLLQAAVVVDTPQAAVAALPPPRVDGLKSQWRRVGDLDVVFVTGAGSVRLRGIADRGPELWDLRTGSSRPLPGAIDGGDLVVELDGPASVVALPVGSLADATAEGVLEEIVLPEVWDVEYLPHGDNRWGDHVLPANDGPPPVRRRTFAHREGDDPAWAAAPVTPEDVAFEPVDVAFTERMYGTIGRPRRDERALGDGWSEVVATYGPKAIVDGERVVEWSERLGIEDLVLTSHIGLKGVVEPVKVDLGDGGRGRVVSFGHVPVACRTALVVEGTGRASVWLDGEPVVGRVDLGVVSCPVELTAGWHEVAIELEPPDALPGPLARWLPPIRTRVGWAFTEPHPRGPVAVWGGARLLHPDYKGSPSDRTFRRRIVVPERAEVRVRAWGSGEVRVDAPEVVDAGEHEIVAFAAGGDGPASFLATIALVLASGAVVQLGTNDLWETAGPDGRWEGACPVGAMSGCVPPNDLPPVPRRNPLLDVAWLEGPESAVGHAEDAWADSPDPPPPSWFCFTAPPGALSMTLPIEGSVSAWVNGAPVAIDDEDRSLPLVEHARVALRVEAPAGYRGAACFREHPVLHLGPGTIRVGTSWHRQGLDCFSGVVLHRTTIEVERAGDAVLDLGEVAGTVAVSVNGSPAGVLLWAPWRLPVTLEAGPNLIELEVANTLGPAMSRGIPTSFGPEDQRTSGLLARPKLRRFGT